jgi:signal transduction histidine kinase
MTIAQRRWLKSAAAFGSFAGTTFPHVWVKNAELIAKAFRAISKETSYEELAKALLKAALGYSGAARGAVLVSEKGELLAEADARFPRERAQFFASQPPTRQFRLPPDLGERVLTRQETIVRRNSWEGSALIDPAGCPPGQDIAQLCLPLIHQDRTIGVLYLESEREQETFTPRCVWVMSMLASQAAVSFESARSFEALTSNWKASSPTPRGKKAAEQALMDARPELARAMRLASLGELAGSIVHEINQPLTGIVMSAEACLRWLARDPAEPDEARKSAMRVIEQGRRASEVVTGLRSLVRGAQLAFTDVQINDAVEEILFLSKRDLERAGVTLRTDFDGSRPNVEGDRVQLQQVVLNLVRNAIDAMAAVNGRARVLTASSKVADGHVSVAIADTGVGIESANRERLFDALYTTKVEGLGLGLSISRKIISVHGGRLWVEENTTYGSTFTFTLPARQSAPMSGS